MVVWQPGMLCVCVSEKFKSTCGSAYVRRLPRKGVVYTIREVRPNGGLWLVEIVNEPQHWAEGFHEFAWHPDRFRPLPDGRLDTLRAFLAPTPRVAEPA